MSYHVIRLGTDFTQSVQAIIKDYLETNWSLTGVLTGTNKGKIMFSTGWWQKQPQYQIHIRHDIDKMPMSKTIGRYPIKKFDDVLQVHCWEQMQTVDAEPTNLDKMTREVQRIINSDALGLSSSGIYNMNCSSARILPLEDSQAAIFHSVQRVEVMYAKRYA